MSFATNYEFPNVDKYDSDLRELLYEYRKLLNEYHTIMTGFENIQTQFEDIQSEFDTLKLQIDTLLSVVDQRIDEGISGAIAKEMEGVRETLVLFQDEVQKELEKKQAEIDSLRDNVNSFMELVKDVEVGAKSYTDTEIQILRGYLNAKISAIQLELDDLQWDLPHVYNITRGYKTDLVTCLYDVYDACRDRAFTVEQFQVSGISCGEFDSKEKTALEWDTQGYEILFPRGTAVSLITGERVTYDTYFEQIIDRFYRDGAMTVSEFDGADLTCQWFDDAENTCYQWDYHGKILLPV